MTRYKAVTKSDFNKTSFRSLQVSNNSRKIKSHLHRGKLHLTKYVSTVLSNFGNKISPLIY